MATPCDTNDRSVPKDGTADQPERYANGSAVIAELRTRVRQAEQHAAIRMHKYNADNDIDAAFVHLGRAGAFRQIFAWLDELSGCDVESTDEAGSRSA